MIFDLQIGGSTDTLLISGGANTLGIQVPNTYQEQRAGSPNCDCCPQCVFYHDDFDRADSDDLGIDWVEDTGNWAIVSSELDPPSNGILLFAKEAPPVTYPEGVMVTGSFVPALAAGTFRVVVDYLDSNNYHYAEYIQINSTTASVRLWKRSGGAETALRDAQTFALSWSLGATLDVCFGEGRMAVVVNSNLLGQSVEVTPIGGSKAGFVTKTIGANARISFARFAQLSAELGCAGCSLFCANCTPEAASLFMTATLVDVPAGAPTCPGPLNNCSTLNNSSWLLSFDWPGLASLGCCVWSLTGVDWTGAIWAGQIQPKHFVGGFGNQKPWEKVLCEFNDTLFLNRYSFILHGVILEGGDPLNLWAIGAYYNVAQRISTGLSTVSLIGFLSWRLGSAISTPFDCKDIDHELPFYNVSSGGSCPNYTALTTFPCSLVGSKVLVELP